MTARMLWRDGKLSTPFILLVSLLASLRLISIDPTINNDGILYLITAEVFLEEGLQAALQIYPWPLISVLTGWLHWLTGLPLAMAAHVLVTGCYLLLTWAFVRLARTLGGGPTVQLFALLVVVLHPQISDFRGAIVRDPGMLAFMLMALTALIEHARQPTVRTQLTWSLAVLMAFLFRVEALFFALLAPWALLWTGRAPWRAKLGSVLILFAPAALLTGLSLLLMAVKYPDLLMGIRLATDIDTIHREFAALGGHLDAFATLVGQELLQLNSVEDARWAALAGLVTLFILSVCRALTLPWVIALLWWWRAGTKPLIFNRDGDLLIRAHLVIICAYLLLFVLLFRFTEERYSLQAAILILLYIPFLLARWWHTERRPSLARAAIVVLFTGLLVATLFNSKHKKAYLDEAATWLREQSLPAETVIANEPHLAYFSQRQSREEVLLSRNLRQFEERHALWQPGQVYAWRVRQGDDARELDNQLQREQAEVLKVFPGDDGRDVVVFWVPRSDTPR